MSDPILSPRRADVVEVAGGPPGALLARGYPPGAAAPAVMLFLLGGWLIASPIALEYADRPQAWSDWASAAAVFALGLAALAAQRPWLSWIAGAVGVWVLLAPIVLGSGTAAAHLSGLVSGALIATFGFVFPLNRRLPGPEVPTGWSYNPSAWPERAPVIALAALSFTVAAYLAAFKLGFLGTIWDPVSAEGTVRVLTSEAARALPFPGAVLGAAVYLIYLLITCTGDARRWRTMPWLVILFGLLTVSIGAVSIMLVILQPLAVGAWCGWCLVTAIATLAMIPFALDEIAATLELLRRVHRRGGSWWRALWSGAEDGEAAPAEPRRARAYPPWTLALVAIAGGWMMLEPAILGTSGAVAGSAYVAGALLIAIAVIAVSEVARAVRLLAPAVALWLVAAPWLLDGSTAASRIASLIVATAVIAASVPRGPIRERHGAVDRLALWPPRLGRSAA
jgi:uncharacterized membrane protein